MAVNKISPKQALEWLLSGEAVLIDVREPLEFKEEHIAYAASLPLSEVRELLKQYKIPTDRKIIFQCLKGTRGQQACVIANEGIFAKYDIYNIDGGITSWKEEGLPVVGCAPKGVSVFRQVQIIVGLLVLLLIMAGLILSIKLPIIIAAILGAALAFAGATGFCGLALMLNKAPWNK